MNINPVSVNINNNSQNTKGVKRNNPHFCSVIPVKFVFDDKLVINGKDLTGQLLNPAIKEQYSKIRGGLKKLIDVLTQPAMTDYKKGSIKRDALSAQRRREQKLFFSKFDKTFNYADGTCNNNLVLRGYIDDRTNLTYLFTQEDAKTLDSARLISNYEYHKQARKLINSKQKRIYRDDSVERGLHIHLLAKGGTEKGERQIVSKISAHRIEDSRQKPI